MPKFGAEFTMGNAAGFQRFHFGNNLGQGYAKTFQVERSRFDDLLLRNAQDAGAEVREQAKVGEIRIRDEGVTLSYRWKDEEHQAEGRWLIDASGRAARVGHVLNLPKSDLDMPKRLAIFAHFSGVHRANGADGGNIVIVRLENAWCWFIPLDEERTSVGLVQLLSDFKSQGVDVEESFARAASHHAELRLRLKKANRLTPFYTEGEYTFRYHQAAGPRWLLAGDAAGFIDPIFSSGVMVALRSSQLAARAILKAEAKGHSLSSREQARYTRQVKKMTTAFLHMIRMFYDRDAFEVFMQPKQRFNLPRGVLNLVGGNTDLSWSLRWRTWAFYAICRLQRHFTITPRLSFEELTPRSTENPAARPAACPPIG
jgi:flavin-dependent dehydrogenase